MPIMEGYCNEMGKNHFNQIIKIIDSWALKFNGFLTLFLWVSRIQISLNFELVLLLWEISDCEGVEFII